MSTNGILAKLSILISANNAEFGKAMSASSKQAESFGKIISSANNTLKAFGIGFGIYEVVGGIKDAIGTASQFEKTMSEVKAITGETGAGFNQLRDDALKLGASTKYSASQVGELQIAYGRLGFTKKEILDATKATIQLATATGEDLAKSADVAGSTVRAFGLNANQTQKVVDVMASSFNRTALGLENFSEAMKYVAPVAANANISIEQTTALLGVLADNGIRGSQAGTSLRKIISDLGQGAGPVLTQKLKELAKSGLSGAQAMDEVGRTAYASLLILSKNTDKVDQAAEAYKNASGEAAKMAAVMSDNLQGDVTKLTSSWDSLVIAFTKTDFLREKTQELTQFFNALHGVDDGTRTMNNIVEAISFSSSEDSLKKFIDNLSEFRKESGKPLEITQFDKLIEKYDLTAKEVERLKSAVDEANKSISFQEKAVNQFNDFAKRNGYTDLKKAADDYVKSINSAITKETNFQQFNKQQEVDTKSGGIFTDLIQKSQDKINAYLKVRDLIKELYPSDSKSDAIIPPAQVGLIQAAEDELKRLQKAKNDAFTVDAIQYFNKLIEEAEVKLATLKDALPFADRRATTTNLGARTPEKTKTGLDFMAESNAIKPAVDNITTGLEQINKAYDKSKTSSEAWAEASKLHFQKVKDASIQLGPLIAQGLSSFAEALGAAAVGVGNFGDNILKAVASFMRSFGEQLIALGTASIAAELLVENPYTAVAAGVALVALSAAAMGAVSKAQSGITGGRTAGSANTGARNTGNLSSNGMQVQVGGEFRILGKDLIYIINRNTQLDTRLHG